MSKRRQVVRAVLLMGLVAAAIIPVSAQDWPQWRGPNRDGAVAFFTGVWPERLQRRWQVEVGFGYATPLLVGSRIYLFTRQGENEVMLALDAASGKTIWRTAYPAPFTMSPGTTPHGPGPKSTPAYANGRLFALSMTGLVSAFDAESGKRLWQKPAGRSQPMYHTAMSPLVEGGTVIVHTGGPGDTALTALDVVTGAPRWSWTGDWPSYGSPIVADLDNTRQIVAFTAQNLVGVSATTGELLWRRPFRTPFNTTAQTPILYKNTIIQTGRENGVTAFRALRKGGKWITEDVWHVDEVSLHLTNAIPMDGVLYGLSERNSGQYFALNLDTGRVLWLSPPRQAEKAAFVRAGSAIVALEDDAEMLVLSDARAGFKPTRRYKVAATDTWTEPTIAGNRVYVKDVNTLTMWTLN